MKILSFIIPAYNSEPYLDKCIHSMLVPEIMEQLEIIVVNDGSKDSTAEIAEKYCSLHPQTVRLISQVNKGHGGALNTGCAAATGKYLKVIDADDWVETENLPKFISLLDQCSSDVVLTHHRTIDIGTGEVKNWRSFPTEFGRSYTFDEIMENWKSFDRSLTFHGITYRTDFYRQNGIQLSEHVFYEDHEFATYPCSYAASITPMDMFIYHYRIGDVNQSVSMANQLKRIGHVETVLQRMTAEYHKIPDTAGKRYAAMKVHGLLLSCLTTALLVNPDKKAGRQSAKKMIAEFQEKSPEIYHISKRKYQVFYLLNLLHIRKTTWDRILNSNLYNKLRKNHGFE